MKNNKATAFITAGGLIILGVFSIVCTMNLIPQGIMSDSYYAKLEEDMTSKIESITIDTGTLVVVTSGNADSVCVKATKSVPTNNSVCWKKVSDDKIQISVFEEKVYYVWLKDSEGNVSASREIKPNNLS